jgi:hypothetical protein
MSQPNAIAALLAMVSKDELQDLARKEIASHDLGCTCAFCESIRPRYAAAPIDHPDDFARAGGEHEQYPFDGDVVIQLKTIAPAVSSIAKSLDLLAGVASDVRNVLRGRDSEGKVVGSPFAAIANILANRPAPAQPPATQRNPTQQATPVQPQVPAQQPHAAPAQAPLFGGSLSQKRVATDAEMQQMIGNLSKFTPKVRFDLPKKWPKESQKGRVILTSNGASGLGSEVDPDYLDIYAESLEYFAGQAKEKVAAGSVDANDKRDAQFGELEAARCRRIAQCIRQGTIQRIEPVPMYQGGAAGQSLI